MLDGRIYINEEILQWEQSRVTSKTKMRFSSFGLKSIDFSITVGVNVTINADTYNIACVPTARIRST